MTNLRYTRVNRRRNCLICGKPDWCSFTPDERISFCARVNCGADRISREGWGVFYHCELSRSNLLRPHRTLFNRSLSLAPIEVRDFVYRKLIEFSPARSSEEVLTCPDGLHDRKILDVSNYGSLPGKVAARNKLASRITRLVIERFPRIAHECRTQGIPGFWTDRRGRARLWSEYDFGAAVLLIPFFNADRMIQACQLRLVGERPLGYSRYFWLSSASKPGGSSPGTPLHYSTCETATPRPLLVTEGPLKAQTAKPFFPDHDIVASGGVSCSHPEIVSAARYRPIEIAFDNDSRENPHVAGALARLLSLRLADQKSYGYFNEQSILTWERSANGLDEALIKGLPIRALSLSDWFRLLTPDCQSAVRSSLERMRISDRSPTKESWLHRVNQKSGGREDVERLFKRTLHDRFKSNIT